jgi:hypothetical protein
MVVYRGVLDDRHLRAAVRIALGAHGLTVAVVPYEKAVAAQWACGTWLRDRVFLERLPAFFAPGEYRSIAELDPYLWNRLPSMAGFGYQQAHLLHRLAPAATDADSTVPILGGLFNAGIALLDYLADECHCGAWLFELLHPDVVGEMFVPGGDAGARLARVSADVPDARARLLLAIVAICEREWRSLHRRSGNDVAWMELANLIGRLYEAERIVTLGEFQSVNEMRQALPAVEAKSELPSTAIWQISELAAARSERISAHGRRLSVVLGRIVCRVDDLVDLLTDCRGGTPSTAVFRVATRLAEQGRTSASDADLYAAVDAGAKELVELLGSETFCERERSELIARDSPIESALGIHKLIPAERRADLLEFAKHTVAGWVGWPSRELPPEPDRPGRSRRCAPNGDAIHQSTNYLLGQHRDGYGEAIHHLCFPRGAAMQRVYETHPALLFQRAVLLDALLDAQEAGESVPEQVLNAEALAILRAKHRDVRGGWSYIPEVPELPPDTDDLGMVLQVLARLGGSELASTCDEAVRLALDAARPDGGFPTWVLDPRSQQPADRTMLMYVDVIGGRGIHADAVANLLYGLILYDPVRYQVPLARSVTYFETAQDARGFWPSKWYAGPYYGTYRVGAVLDFVAPGSAALAAARAFLRDTQRPDGGWGEHRTDALSTALATLALALPGMETPDAVIDRSIESLVALQNSDGAWPASPFISFPTMDGVETYASRTITTAFCLKALRAGASGARAMTA